MFAELYECYGIAVRRYVALGEAVGSIIRRAATMQQERQEVDAGVPVQRIEPRRLSRSISHDQLCWRQQLRAARRLGGGSWSGQWELDHGAVDEGRVTHQGAGGEGRGVRLWRWTQPDELDS
jgi:hypothetical protein